MNDYGYLSDKLNSVRQKLEEAAKRGGFPCPTLVAVTKKMTDDELLCTVKLGICDIAENYPQNFARRYDLLKSHGISSVRMHMIGSLQTNKVKLIVGRASLIHSVDSLHLAREIDRHAQNLGTVCDLLIEINSGNEESKGGIDIADTEKLCEDLHSFNHIRVAGLMTMAPKFEDKEEYRPCFRKVRKLFLQMAEKGSFSAEEPILSMGMSDSYDIAAEEGATLVRIGQALYDSPERII